MTKTLSALLSFGAGADQGDALPRGLTGLFAGTVASWQVDGLLTLGVRHFLFAVEQLPGAAAQLVETIRSAGGTVDVVRAPSDVGRLLAPEQRLLVVAEGLWCDPALLSDFVRIDDEAVAVVDDAAGHSAFERIDIAHRWAGLAMVRNATIAATAGLPADWSVESALMRQALRGGAERIVVPPVRQGSVGIAIVGPPGVASQIEDRAIDAAAEVRGGPVDRRIFAPLIRRFLPLAWRRREVALLGEIAPPALGLVTLGIAYAGWPVAAAAGAIATLFARKWGRAVAQLSGNAAPQWPGIAALVLLALALPRFLSQGMAVALPHLLFAAAMAGLVALVRLTPLSGSWDPWRPGLPECAFVLGTTAALASTFAAAWTVILASLAILLWGRFIEGRKA